MLNWTDFNDGQVIALALVFLRMVSFVMALPVIGTGPVIAPVKILLSLTLTAVMFPTLKFNSVTFEDSVLIYFVIREVLMGLIFGYLVRFYFFAVSVAGEMIGVSSGLASSQIFNPSLGSSSTVVEQFYTVVASLLFFTFQLHHFFLLSFTETFQLFQVGYVDFNLFKFSSWALSFQEILIIGFKLAAPIMISILLTNVTMGIMGKAVPQMNVFITSLQVTFMVTVLLMAISLPFFVMELETVFGQVGQLFIKSIKGI